MYPSTSTAASSLSPFSRQASQIHGHCDSELLVCSECVVWCGVLLRVLCSSCWNFERIKDFVLLDHDASWHGSRVPFDRDGKCENWMMHTGFDDVISTTALVRAGTGQARKLMEVVQLKVETNHVLSVGVLQCLESAFSAFSASILSKLVWTCIKVEMQSLLYFLLFLFWLCLICWYCDLWFSQHDQMSQPEVGINRRE